MLRLRRPELPEHVLAHQPFEDFREVEPSRAVKCIQRLLPNLVDPTVERGKVYFVTNNPEKDTHFFRFLSCSVRESGIVVADHFQRPSGHGPVWTNGISSGPYNGVYETFPILEDPDYIPRGEVAVTSSGS